MKILLADDHQLIRDGLRSLLAGLTPEPPGLLEASSFAQSHAQLVLHPDTALAIVDMRMDDASGSEMLEDFSRKFKSVPLVVLSGFLQPEGVRTLLRLDSVYAVVSKGGDPDTLRFVVLEALAGRKTGDASRLLDGVKNAAASSFTGDVSLSPRLKEIYALLREGKSNKAIAWELKLTEGTVKNYVSLIYKELEVHNRIQAAWYASNKTHK